MPKVSLHRVGSSGVFLHRVGNSTILAPFRPYAKNFWGSSSGPNTLTKKLPTLCKRTFARIALSGPWQKLFIRVLTVLLGGGGKTSWAWAGNDISFVSGPTWRAEWRALTDYYSGGAQNVLVLAPPPGAFQCSSCPVRQNVYCERHTAILVHGSKREVYGVLHTTYGNTAYSA